MSWNYRIIARDGFFMVHEVYDDGRSWTEEAASPVGDSLNELADDIARFVAALGLPALIEKDGYLEDF
jgi:hypothetical protein